MLTTPRTAFLPAAIVSAIVGASVNAASAAAAHPTCKFLEAACETEAQHWQAYISKSRSLPPEASSLPTVAQCQVLYGVAESASQWPAPTPVVPAIPCTP